MCGEASWMYYILEVTYYDICWACKKQFIIPYPADGCCSMAVFEEPGCWFFKKQKTWLCSYNSIHPFHGKWQLKKELLDYFQFSVDTPSVSAFIQQRSKLLPEAFQFLFYEFNSLFSFQKNYKGYQLLACDGSDLNIARNPNDTDTYLQSRAMDKGYNQLHLNALYDLCEKRYANVVV